MPGEARKRCDRVWRVDGLLTPCLENGALRRQNIGVIMMKESNGHKRSQQEAEKF
jgi:hypothetical protein